MAGKVGGRSNKVARWLRRGDQSAVAMELGIIAVPFFIMFLGSMEIAYDLYVQATLNNAVELAARSIQIGSATGASGENSSTYVTANVCPNLGGLLDCALLTVAVAPILPNKDYYTSPIQQTMTQAAANTGGEICTATGGTPMVLKAWYNGPTFLGLLVPSFTTIVTPNAGGSTVVHITQASAAFVNEYFSGGQTAGAGCGV
jgi:Flp pilus assembly protein TadG